MINRVSQKFGRWTVIKFDCVKRIKDRNVYFWICECSCDDKTKKSIRENNLGKSSSSCGCLKREMLQERVLSEEAIENIRKSATKHGMHGTRTYNCWRAMLDRCSKPKRDHYDRYGGCGITVCDRWKEAFENFFEDIGECPKKYELDRIDNNGHYTPENCQWISHQEQTNNRSTSHFLDYESKRLTVAQWDRETGISQSSISNRLKKGWSIEKTLTQPVRTRS